MTTNLMELFVVLRSMHTVRVSHALEKRLGNLFNRWHDVESEGVTQKKYARGQTPMEKFFPFLQPCGSILPKSLATVSAHRIVPTRFVMQKL